MIATQTIAIVIRNCVENDLLDICIKIRAKYDSGGHGRMGKKFPTNHRNRNNIHNIISVKSIWF